MASDASCAEDTTRQPSTDSEQGHVRGTDLAGIWGRRTRAATSPPKANPCEQPLWRSSTQRVPHDVLAVQQLSTLEKNCSASGFAAFGKRFAPDLKVRGDLSTSEKNKSCFRKSKNRAPITDR